MNITNLLSFLNDDINVKTSSITQRVFNLNPTPGTESSFNFTLLNETPRNFYLFQSQIVVQPNAALVPGDDINIYLTGQSLITLPYDVNDINNTLKVSLNLIPQGKELNLLVTSNISIDWIDFNLIFLQIS